LIFSRFRAQSGFSRSSAIGVPNGGPEKKQIPPFFMQKSKTPSSMQVRLQISVSAPSWNRQ